MFLKTCARTDAEFHALREKFARGQLPVSWPMFDGVPAQPTRLRRGSMKGAKPYPIRTHEVNGQARRPGVWCADDESVFSCRDEAYTDLLSPEDTILGVIDNGRELGHFPHRKWFRNAAQRDDADQKFTPDPYDAVFEANLQAAIAHSHACARVPDRQMVRLKALRAEAMDLKAKAKKPVAPKAEVAVQPKPAPKRVLKTGLRLNAFADLVYAIAA